MKNEPAFPRSAYHVAIGSSGFDNYAQTGMTLRDYFAAKAMQALISQHEISVNLAKGKASGEDVCRLAYVWADGMLQEREKGKEDERD